MTLGRWSNFSDEEIRELKLNSDVRDGEIPIREGTVVGRLNQELVEEMQKRGFTRELDPSER